MNALSQRIASRGQRRQLHLMRLVKRLAFAADRAARDVLSALTTLAKENGPGVNRVQGQLLLRKLPHVLFDTISAHLKDIAQWAHQAAAGVLSATLPEDMLRQALHQRGFVRESRQLFEREPFDLGLPDEVEDLDKLERLFRQMLFPPPPEEYLDRLIYGTGWFSRLESLSRLASPNLLATTVATGLAQGKTPQEISSELLPIVNNVRSSAKRIARTEAVRVGHEIQMDAWDELGDMVIGYQIHHTPNPNARQWHIERDGTVYYKEPGPGQKGLEQMPRPPMEAPDPDERPPGTPQVAPNCLCWLTPILSEQQT